MTDVFISYSRNDRDRCLAIRDALAALKVNVWSDARIGAGAHFDREIEREIAAAKALLVLWSDNSVESDWVRNEARTGKEEGRLVATQITSCQLPLEFRSVQAELLPEGAEGTDNAAWLGVVARIGELIGRPGLGEYARLGVSGSLDEWKRWLGRFPSDPLAGDVIDNIVERAMPDMRQQLAGERAKRAALEAELAEHADAARAQSAEVATGAREVARLRRELEEARVGQREAESELARFRAASGSKAGDDSGGLAGLGIVLEHKLALYVCALLWIAGIRFCWDGLGNLMKGYAGFGDIFSIVFGVVAIIVPAVIVTLKILRKRSAMAREEVLEQA
jgi:hypothetical protein